MRATIKYRLEMTEKAQKIVDKLSLEKKIYLMSGSLVDLTKISMEQLGEGHHPEKAGIIILQD